MKPKLNQRTNETNNGSYGDPKLKTWTQFTSISPFFIDSNDIFHVQKKKPFALLFTFQHLISNNTQIFIKLLS
jgi:hypothetical protein